MQGSGSGSNSLRKLRRDWWKTRLCTSCVSPLGRIIARGGICPQCGLRVCKNCRTEAQPRNGTWVCVSCSNGGIDPDVVWKTKSLERDSRSIRRSWTVSTKPSSWAHQRPQSNSPVLKSYIVLQPDETERIGAGSKGPSNTNGSGDSRSSRSASTGSRQNPSTMGSNHRQFHSLPRMNFEPDRSKSAKRSSNQEFEKENIKRHRSFQSTLHPYPQSPNPPPSPSASINFIEEAFWDYYDYDIDDTSSPGATPNGFRRPRFRSFPVIGQSPASILHRRNSIRNRLESDMQRILRLNGRTDSNRSSCERSLGETYDYEYSKSCSLNNFTSLSDTELTMENSLKLEHGGDKMKSLSSDIRTTKGAIQNPNAFYKFAAITPINMSPVSEERKENDPSRSSPRRPPLTSTPVKPERKCNNSKRSMSLNSYDYDSKKLFSPLKTYVLVTKDTVIPNNISNAPSTNKELNTPEEDNRRFIITRGGSMKQEREQRDTSGSNVKPTKISSINRFHSLPRERIIRIEREDSKFAKPRPKREEHGRMMMPQDKNNIDTTGGDRKKNHVSRVEITRSFSSVSSRDRDSLFERTPNNNREASNIVSTSLIPGEGNRRITRSQSHREISTANRPHIIITSSSDRRSLERNPPPFLSVVKLGSSSPTFDRRTSHPTESATLPLIRRGASTTLHSNQKSDDRGRDTKITEMGNLLRKSQPLLNPSSNASHVPYSGGERCGSDGRSERVSSKRREEGLKMNEFENFHSRTTVDDHSRQCSTFPRALLKQKNKNNSFKEEEEKKRFEVEPKSGNRYTSRTLITHDDDNFVKSWDDLSAMSRSALQRQQPTRTISEVQLNKFHHTSSSSPSDSNNKSNCTRTHRPESSDYSSLGWSVTLPHPYVRKHKEQKASFGKNTNPLDEKSRINDIERQIERDIYFQKTQSLDRARINKGRPYSVLDKPHQTQYAEDVNKDEESCSASNLRPVPSPRLKRKTNLLLARSKSDAHRSSSNSNSFPRPKINVEGEVVNVNGSRTNYYPKEKLVVPNEPRACKDLNTHLSMASKLSSPVEPSSTYANASHYQSQLGKLPTTTVNKTLSFSDRSQDQQCSTMKITASNLNQKSAVVQEQSSPCSGESHIPPPIATPRTRRRNIEKMSCSSSGHEIQSQSAQPYSSSAGGTMDGVNDHANSHKSPQIMKAVRFEPHIIEMENEREHNKVGGGVGKTNGSAMIVNNNNFNNKPRQHLGTSHYDQEKEEGGDTTIIDSTPHYSSNNQNDLNIRREDIHTYPARYQHFSYAGKGLYHPHPSGPKSLKSIKQRKQNGGGFVARAIAKVKGKAKISNKNGNNSTKGNLIHSTTKLRSIETRDSITYIVSSSPTEDITSTATILNNQNPTRKESTNDTSSSSSQLGLLGRSESFSKSPGILKNIQNHNAPAPLKPERSSLKKKKKVVVMDDENENDTPAAVLSVDQLTPSSTSSSASSSYLSNLQESYDLFHPSEGDEEECHSIQDESDLFRSCEEEDEDARQDFIFYSSSPHEEIDQNLLLLNKNQGDKAQSQSHAKSSRGDNEDEEESSSCKNVNEDKGVAATYSSTPLKSRLNDPPAASSTSTIQHPPAIYNYNHLHHENNNTKGRSNPININNNNSSSTTSTVQKCGNINQNSEPSSSSFPKHLLLQSPTPFVNTKDSKDLSDLEDFFSASSSSGGGGMSSSSSQKYKSSVLLLNNNREEEEEKDHNILGGEGMIRRPSSSTPSPPPPPSSGILPSLPKLRKTPPRNNVTTVDISGDVGIVSNNNNSNSSNPANEFLSSRRALLKKVNKDQLWRVENEGRERSAAAAKKNNKENTNHSKAGELTGRSNINNENDVHYYYNYGGEEENKGSSERNIPVILENPKGTSSSSYPSSTISSIDNRGGVFSYNNCDPEISISSFDLGFDASFDETKNNKSVTDKARGDKDNKRTIASPLLSDNSNTDTSVGDCDDKAKTKQGLKCSGDSEDANRAIRTATNEEIVKTGLLDEQLPSLSSQVVAVKAPEEQEEGLKEDMVQCREDEEIRGLSNPKISDNNNKIFQSRRRESPEGQEQEDPVVHPDDKGEQRNVKTVAEPKKSLGLEEVIIMEKSHKGTSCGKVLSKSEIRQNALSQISSSRSSPDGADAERSEAGSSTATTEEPEIESPTPTPDQFDVTSDEDSWVEEILFEDDDSEIQMCRKAQPPPIDFTLHTIVEESCEESCDESGNFNSPEGRNSSGSRHKRKLIRQKQNANNDNELEKYFNFGIDNGSVGSRQSLTNNDESEFSDTFSESSFSLQDQDDHDEGASSSLAGKRRTSTDEPDPAELASSRLEKYFYNLGLPQSMMNPITSINQNVDADSDSIADSESESDNSVLENRKKVLKHHRRSVDLEDELADTISDEEDVFGFGQDGFDTIKKTARKTKRSSSDDGNNSSKDKSSENLSVTGQPGSSHSSKSSDARNTSKTSEEKSSSSSLLSKHDFSNPLTASPSPSTSSSKKGHDRPVIKVNRSNSFQWSSDEEVNIMMSKLRQIIRNLVKSKSEANSSGSNSTGPHSSSSKTGIPPESESNLPSVVDKDKQLAYYLESELIRLMKTENLKNFVEYLSSEESDVDDVYKFIKVVKESSADDTSEDFGDIDLEDPDLLHTLHNSIHSDSESISPKGSPALLAKVMHHIGNRLSVWMKDENVQDDNDDNVTLKCAQSVSSDLNEDRFSWKGSFESALAAKRQSVGSTDSISSSDFNQDRSILRSSSLHHLANSAHHLGQVEEHKEEEEMTSSLPRMTNLCNSLPRLNQPSNLSISRAHSLVMSGKEPSLVSSASSSNSSPASGPIKSARYRPPGFQPVKSMRMDDEGKNSPILSQSTPMLTHDPGHLKIRSDSMGSIFHDATKTHISVKGQIEFGLQYNYKLACLEVRVKQCRDLAAVDTKRNRSDPYVKAYLLPDRSKSGKRKTKVKKNTLNPVFDEVLKFPLTLSDLQNRTLWISVWHSDIFGKNEFLGEVLVDLKDRVFDDTTPQLWELQEMSGQIEDMPRGDIVIALKWQPKTDAEDTGTLSVLVKEAKNLPPARNGGSPSSIIKCSLLSDKSRKHVKKTSVCRRSYNPVWNQTLTFDDATNDGLEITLWNHDLLSNNELFGTVRLEYDHALWASMLSRHSFWVEGSLRLT